MIGTPLYRRKHDNKDPGAGYVGAAEVDLINNRLLGAELQKLSVFPLLLEGEKATSLPPLLHGRVYADFRNELGYFATPFDLILSLYQIPPNDSVVADLSRVTARAGVQVRGGQLGIELSAGQRSAPPLNAREASWVCRYRATPASGCPAARCVTDGSSEASLPVRWARL